MSEERKLVSDFKRLTQEYAYDDSIFCDDDPKVSALKYIINHKLNQVDRTIITLYADCMSYRKLGQRMGISHMTIRREVVRIREEILKQLKELSKQDFRV